jgi:hypothetical protein
MAADQGTRQARLERSLRTGGDAPGSSERIEAPFLQTPNRQAPEGRAKACTPEHKAQSSGTGCF